jgi:hypothetical protein
MLRDLLRRGDTESSKTGSFPKQAEKIPIFAGSQMNIAESCEMLFRESNLRGTLVTSVRVAIHVFWIES